MITILKEIFPTLIINKMHRHSSHANKIGWISFWRWFYFYASFLQKKISLRVAMNMFLKDIDQLLSKTNVVQTENGTCLSKITWKVTSLILNRLWQILLSRSAHRTPNFPNPEFQFSQFKVLCKVFFLFNTASYIGIFGCILILI